MVFRTIQVGHDLTIAQRKSSKFQRSPEKAGTVESLFQRTEIVNTVPVVFTLQFAGNGTRKQ